MRESYRTQAEATKALERYAKLKIPAHRDPHNWGKLRDKWTIEVYPQGVAP